MELSQKELPLQKRFDLIVRHNKVLMCKNTLLEQELASHVALKAKYDDLKWQFERLKEEKDFFNNDTSLKKKIKVARRMLQEYGLFEKFLMRLSKLNKTRQ